MLRILSIILLIVGIGFLGYGGFQLYQTHAMESERLDEASEFISNVVIKDINNISETDEMRYEEFKTDETIGIFYIPRLDREIPIIEGTDEDELAKGVGHYSGTGFPGQNNQILLSGHRDTVFRDFGELQDGDELHIKMEQGTFVYVIKDSETQIVPADDTTVIDPNRQDEVLTVSTCYPFSFIGNAPNRYVIYAYPK
ncbi:MAG TPA: class D sortase [Bacillota bacterium]|nr:class D sortase [Bacillota bacterium]